VRRVALPTVASQCAPLAEQAEREREPYLGYLEALFAAELEDRERRAIERRIKEAHLPRVKTLDEFDFRQAPSVSPTRLSELAEGGYIERAEPIVFIGDSGTGKTHLLTALCVAACRQRRRVRFTTAAALVNELVEAKQQLQLRRVLARWARYDVIAIDEVGYVPLAELGAEFLFQVVSDRAEQAAVLLTTNLPFSEWTQVIPNARLCKALLDRITDRAHIIETGSDSYRFRRTLELRGRHGRSKTTDGAIPNLHVSTEKGSPPGTPVPKRDDCDDDGGSAAAVTPTEHKEESLTLPD
jgi:DNA replication protein DnaC